MVSDCACRTAESRRQGPSGVPPDWPAPRRARRRRCPVLHSPLPHLGSSLSGRHRRQSVAWVVDHLPSPSISACSLTRSHDGVASRSCQHSDLRLPARGKMAERSPASAVPSVVTYSPGSISSSRNGRYAPQDRSCSGCRRGDAGGFAARPAVAIPECSGLGIDDFRTDRAEPLGSPWPACPWEQIEWRMAGSSRPSMIPADLHQDVTVDAAGSALRADVAPGRTGAARSKRCDSSSDRCSLRPVIRATDSAVARPLGDP